MNNSKTIFCILLLYMSAMGLRASDVAVEEVDSASMHNLNEVVVTGSNSATGRNLLPYTVSTIGQSEIEATGQTQLLSALSGRVPGLFVTQRNVFGFGISNGGSGGIKVRGVGGSPTNGVLMMVDGQPQFAGIYSHHVADFYETEYVDHVEVLRGPGSVLYGSNAMGGVINVITRKAQEDGVRTTLRSEYGSYNTWLSSLTNTVRHGRFTSLVSLGFDRTDGLQSDFDFRQQSAYAKVGYELSRHWQLSADYSYMQFVGNDPIYPRLSKPESTDIYHQNVIRGESSLMLTDKYDATDGALRVYYSYGNHFIDDPKHFHSLDDRFGILAYQNFRPWSGARLTLGFDFDTYTGSIRQSGGNSYKDDTQPARMQTFRHKSVTEYSPYLTVSQGFWHGVLVLDGGLRMANSDRFGTHFIPQAGFTVRPAEGWMAKASVAKGYRNPSFREMYLYKMANPELDPESMMNYELTLGRSWGGNVTLELTGYFAEGSDMIQVLNMKNVNTGSFRNKGIELSASARICPQLTMRGSYSYLHSSLDNLTGAPRHQFYVSASWRPVDCLTFDVDMRSVGHLYVDDDVDLQDFTLLGLRSTWRVCRWVDVFVNFDNMVNSTYLINKGYEMPGFSVRGGFKANF